MNHDDKTGQGDKGSGRWLRRNLVALSSAAVLTVYAAGYARTKPAADRFANETASRRLVRTTGPQIAATAPAVVQAANNSVTPTPAKPTAPTKVPKKSAATKKASKVSAPKQSVPAPAPAPQLAQPLVAAATDSATDTTAANAPKWKDGTYSAWGTSRHGDLEATVEIKDGRIVAAYITQCWTRYPCSRIGMLPPQVVERQSENVDVVSGATQSADAFYYAVLQALVKAK